MKTIQRDTLKSIINESVKVILNEYLDNQILMPIKKSIERKPIQKYKDNLKDRYNFGYFVHWLADNVARGPASQELDELYWDGLDEINDILDSPEKYDEATIKGAQEKMDAIYNNILKRYGKYIKRYHEENWASNGEYADGRYWNNDIIFKNPQPIKNQWLIHFTNYPTPILKNGFMGKKIEPNNLGWTTGGQFNDSLMSKNGVVFAYSPYDFKINRGLGYGKYAILFRASGMEVKHGYEGEKQIMVNASLINKDTFVLLRFNPKYESDMDSSGEPYRVYQGTSIEILSLPTLKPIVVFNDMNKVMDWVENNFQNYRKSLNVSSNGYNDMIQNFLSIKHEFEETVREALYGINPQIISTEDMTDSDFKTLRKKGINLYEFQKLIKFNNGNEFKTFANRIKENPLFKQNENYISYNFKNVGEIEFYVNYNDDDTEEFFVKIEFVSTILRNLGMSYDFAAMENLLDLDL